MRIIFFIALAAILFSCDKEEIMNSQMEVPTTAEVVLNSVTVEFNNGLATIPSWSDAAIIETVFYDKNESLEARNKIARIANFTSAENAYQAINADDFTDGTISEIIDSYAYLRGEDNDSYVDPIVEHEMLRYLVNTKRQIIIGDKFCTVNQKQIITIPINEIEQFGDSPLESPNVGIITFKKDRPTVTDTQAKINVARCRYEYGTRRRVTGEIEITDNIFQNGPRLNVRTKHYRRKKFTGNVWWGERADFLAHDGAVALLNSGSGVGTPGLVSKTDEQNFATTILEQDVIELELFFGGFFNFAQDGGATDGECFSVPGGI